MAVLGIPPGPLVGRAYAFLRELRLEHGPLGREQAVQELLGWAAEAGLPAAPAPGSAPAADPGEDPG